METYNESEISVGGVGKQKERSIKTVSPYAKQ